MVGGLAAMDVVGGLEVEAIIHLASHGAVRFSFICSG